MARRSWTVFVLVVFIVLEGCSKAVYREVKRKDEIKFYSTIEMFQAGALEGFQFFIIGDDGNPIAIPLTSSAVVEGQVETRDFGILKIKLMGKSDGLQLFATESQIRELRALAASKHTGQLAPHIRLDTDQER